MVPNHKLLMVNQPYLTGAAISWKPLTAPSTCILPDGMLRRGHTATGQTQMYIISHQQVLPVLSVWLPTTTSVKVTTQQSFRLLMAHMCFMSWWAILLPTVTNHQHLAIHGVQRNWCQAIFVTELSLQAQHKLILTGLSLSVLTVPSIVWTVVALCG